jgi:hypothetical protein
LDVTAAWTGVLGVAAVVVWVTAAVVDRFVAHDDVRKREKDEDELARAIVLMLMRDNTQVSLAVMNQSRLGVTSLHVDCWPDASPPGEPPRQLPPFAPATMPEVTWEPIYGGGQSSIVTWIRPSPVPDSGTGPTLGVWTVPPLPTPVVFEVSWLDHQQRARHLVGRADLGHPLPITNVELNPPPPPTTPPTWRDRVRRLYLRLTRHLSRPATRK